MKKLQNKVAVITGGNSGIGKGIAKRFYEDGANVVIFGRKLNSLKETKNEIGEDILLIQGDVTQTTDLQRLFAETVSHFGKIDILVANSGVSELVSVEEATEEQFDYIVNTNYRGLFFTVRYALNHFNANGSIILISSCAAHVSIQHHSIYSSTKAAVLKLAKNFANDLSGHGIRVNSISPGFIETPIFAERIQQDPAYLEQKKLAIPLKRIGTPEDIAKAASFLASDDSSYITGTDILIDGGLTASFPLP